MRGGFLVGLCLVLSVTVASAPSTGTVAVIVRHSSGAVLPGVAVTVTNSATQEKRPVLTDEAGRYAAPLLPAGTYSLRFELAGFNTVRREGVVLRVTERLGV